jgi:hypothetical protein
MGWRDAKSAVNYCAAATPKILSSKSQGMGRYRLRLLLT